MNFSPAVETVCPVVGHEGIRAALELELPAQPLLIVGPESTGKWTMARWIAIYHAPWHNLRVLEKPQMDEIRDLRHFFLTQPRISPVGSGCKVVAINLDGAPAGSRVQNALLKDLEEPPEFVRFILVASRFPLTTITSRCDVRRWGRLTDEEVAQVLVLNGKSSQEATTIAPVGRGQVAPALAAAERFRPAKAAVLGAVRAISIRDNDLFEHVVKGWGETEDWMLRELLGAAASGSPTALFSSTERQILGSTVARKGIALLATSGWARPQVAIRALAAALMIDER